MITQTRDISTSVESKYKELFEKATSALHENNKLDKNDSITSINDYFLHIRDLADINPSNPTFLRLPLDEPTLKIDANSRKIITQGTPFATNGISVTGDVISEIIFFEIDRYFDITDLASPDMNIIVQWKNISSKDGDYAASKIFIRDTTAEEGKLIFGWPIDEFVTAESGSIEFSVRFYETINQYNELTGSYENVLKYSFSTLPAVLKINDTLNHDVLNGTVEINDYKDFILGRLTNSSAEVEPGNTSIATPEWISTWDNIVDLNEEGYRDLTVQAYTSGLGALKYKWNFVPWDKSLSTIAWNDIYELTDDEYFNAKNVYYRDRTPDDADDINYSLYSDYEVGDLIPDDNSIYERYSRVRAVKAGVYTPYAQNLVGKLTKTIEGQSITIPGPSKPVIDNSVNYNVIVNEDYQGVLSVPAAGDGELSYQWHRGDGTVIEGATAATYNVTDGSATMDDRYYVTITNKRNKETTSLNSEEYRVTAAAIAPEIIMTPSTVDLKNVSILKPNSVSVPNDLSDALSYIWYYSNAEDGEYSEIGRGESLSITRTGFYKLEITNHWNNTEATASSIVWVVTS